MIATKEHRAFKRSTLFEPRFEGSAGDSRAATRAEQNVEGIRHVRDSGDVRERVCDLDAARARRNAEHHPASALAATEVADRVDAETRATRIHGHRELRSPERSHRLECERHSVELLGIAGVDLAKFVDEYVVRTERHRG